MKNSQPNLRSWKRLTKIIILLVLFCTQSAFADPIEQWQKLKTAADRCYCGRDIDLKFEVGTIQNSVFDELESQQFGKIIFSLPLLSKEKSLQRDNSKRAFIDQGVELIQIIEATDQVIKQKNQYLTLLQKVENEEALVILEKVMAVRAEIIEIQTKRNAARQRLEGFFKCLKKLN